MTGVAGILTTDALRLTGGGAGANGGGVGGPGSIMPSGGVFGCLLSESLAAERCICSLDLGVLCSGREGDNASSEASLGFSRRILSRM